MSKSSAPKSARRPRRPEPFFRSQTRSWYVQIRGRQISLGRDRKLAWAKYQELVATNDGLASQLPVAKLLDDFLDFVLKNRAPDTFRWYRHYLKSFVGFFGSTQRVSSLRPWHVTQWLDESFSELGTTSRNCAVRALKAAFNWAVTEGHLDRSPIRAVKRPPAATREMVLTVDEFMTRILSRCTDEQERDLMTFLWETGARVQEIRRISAQHVDLPNRRIVLPPSEDKVGEYRVIYLTDVAHEIIKRLFRFYPDQVLFRNRRGRPWTSNAIRCRFRKFGIPGLCGTILRHSFCQRLLTSGVDSLTVSVLLGHRDLTMVARTYSHLAQNANFLHGQLRHAATNGANLRYDGSETPANANAPNNLPTALP